METPLGLLFLTILSISAVSVESRNLQDSNGAPLRSAHVCSCSRSTHSDLKVDKPDTLVHTQDQPNEFFRQRDQQQVADFLGSERCGCGCQNNSREAVTTEDMAKTTVEVGVSTDDLPSTTDLVSEAEGNTVISNTSPPTSNRPLKFNTTCTDSECLTVVSAPDKADITLRYRCIPPQRCGLLYKKSNSANKEDKGEKQTQSDVKSEGGGDGGVEKVQSSSGHSSKDKTQGSSSYSLVIHQTQSSSGYSLQGHRTPSHNSSSGIIEGDNKFSSSSLSAVDHLMSEGQTNSSVSQGNNGSRSKSECSPSDATLSGSNDTTPIHTTTEPVGKGKPASAGSGGYGGIGGRKPGYAAFAASLNFPEPLPSTTQRSTETTMQAQPVQNSPQEKFLTPPSCGVFKETLLRRIKGGTPAEVGRWPWIVAYGYATEPDGEPEWKCAGALITAKSSITAAHCIDHPTMILVTRRQKHPEPMPLPPIILQKKKKPN